jgi:hypothetical protein
VRNWKGGVEDDLRKLNVKNWWTVAKARELRKKILREAKAGSQRAIELMMMTSEEWGKHAKISIFDVAGLD